MLLPVVILCFTIQILTAGVPAKSSGAEAVRRDRTERNLIIKKPFTSVRVEGNYKIIYTVGSANKMRLSGREDLVRNTEVTVHNDTLKIHLRHEEVMRQLRSRKGWSVKVYVTAPAFSMLSILNGGSVNMDTGMTVDGKLVVRALADATFIADKGLACDTIVVSGTDGSTADIKDLRSKVVMVSASKGGRIAMSGTAGKVSANASSGTNIDLSGLEAPIVSVKATVGGTVTTCKGAVKVRRSTDTGINDR